MSRLRDLKLITGHFWILITTAGCSSISLHDAMERLHNVQYLDLFASWEAKDLQGVKGAAQSLRVALDDPAIAGYSSDDDYQKYLDRTRAVAEDIVQKADAFQLTENSLRLRRQLYNSCQACHKAYRL